MLSFINKNHYQSLTVKKGWFEGAKFGIMAGFTYLCRQRDER
jgi:hypothetical protein